MPAREHALVDEDSPPASAPPLPGEALETPGFLDWARGEELMDGEGFGPLLGRTPDDGDPYDDLVADPYAFTESLVEASKELRGGEADRGDLLAELGAEPGLAVADLGVQFSEEIPGMTSSPDDAPAPLDGFVEPLEENSMVWDGGEEGPPEANATLGELPPLEQDDDGDAGIEEPFTLPPS
jgi:hypothetical protein